MANSKQKTYKVKWKPIEFETITKPKNGNLFTMEEFIELIKFGGIIDDDGFGEYATEDMVSGIRVHPSDYYKGKLKMDHTHVLWYNC